MPNRSIQAAARRAATADRARLTEDLVRLAADAGFSARRLASEAGLSHPYVARTLQGRTRPTIETYAALGAVLGADLVSRLYPNTGPAIRDRLQAPILEWILGELHPRWTAFTEAGVRHPARGWIDLVLHEARECLAIASEIQSELRRIEQVVRWSQEKAAALPSWARWSLLGDEPQISRLMIVRRTRETRAVAGEFSRQLTVAFPAHPDDAMAALTGTTAWPGPALIWVNVERGIVRFAPGR